ncbi:MAG: 7TM diverse intracellular signaling domain-containing protein [Flavobacteriaceae bacterium]
MRRLFLVLFFLLAEISFSQTIVIDSQFTKIKPLSELSYIADFENAFDTLNIVNQSFKTVTKQNIGIKKGSYWFKIKIDNSTKESKKIFFDVREAVVSQVNVYKFEKGKPNLVYNLTPQQFLENEQRLEQNLSIPIILSESELSEFYINVIFPKTAYFPLIIRSEQDEYKNWRYSLLRKGLYYGFALMVFILNFFFYVSLKDNTFLYYLIFLTAITCSLLYYDGFFYEVLQKGWFLYHIENFAHFSIALTGALFATKFLQLPIYFKTINKVGIGFLIVISVLYIIQIITKNFLFLALADALGFFLLTLYWVTAILILKKHDYARFFVLGYSLMLFITTLYVLPLDFGFSGFGIRLAHLKLGGLLEMLFLTYAITYRTKILRNEYNFISLELHEFIDKYMHLELTIKSSKKNDDAIATKLESLKKTHALSDRETEVLLCIAQHKTNKEIAEYLYLSVNTIKFHTRNLYEKLDINTRAAVRHKLEDTL